MARGQKQAADEQRKTTNAIGAQEQTRSNALEDQLTPGYTSLMDTGYLSPEEEGAAVTGEMGAATQPFEAAGFKANNRAAATNNASDLTAQEDQLALEEGRTSGEAAANLNREKMQNQEAGMYGLHGLQSGNQQAMESMYGLGPGELNARAAGGGWAQGFSQVASALRPGGAGGTYGMGMGGSGGGDH